MPDKLQESINQLLPLLNAHQMARQGLGAFLLVVHLKDLSYQGINLILGSKEWDELQPEMQQTAFAVARLALGLWQPNAYLMVSEAIILGKYIQELGTSTAPIETRGAVFTQALYLLSLVSESTALRTILETYSKDSTKGASDQEKGKAIPEIIPFCKWLFTALKACQIPMLFRRIFQGVQPQLFMSFIYGTGCAYQVLYIGAELFASSTELRKLNYSATTKIFAIIGIAGPIFKSYVLENIAEPSLNFLENGLRLVSIIVIPLFELLQILENWGYRGNFHVGVTGLPVKMEDVFGCGEAKKCLLKLADQLKNPTRYSALGPIKPVKGILFYGPPGTGKSMLAKAFASTLESDLFIEQSGSSFVQIYVGKGAQNVRALFRAARSLAKNNPTKPVIIFIDEINGIAGKRTLDTAEGHSEDKSTTEAFLVEIDKLPENVIVIGATNSKPNDLDPAFVRPGRFDEHIQFELPKVKERQVMLKELLKKFKVESSINSKFLDDIATEMKDWSYAEVNTLIQQAAREAGYTDQIEITQKVFQEAYDQMKKKKGENGPPISMYG